MPPARTRPGISGGVGAGARDVPGARGMRLAGVCRSVCERRACVRRAVRGWARGKERARVAGSPRRRQARGDSRRLSSRARDRRRQVIGATAWMFEWKTRGRECVGRFLGMNASGGRAAMAAQRARITQTAARLARRDPGHTARTAPLPRRRPPTRRHGANSSPCLSTLRGIRVHTAGNAQMRAHASSLCQAPCPLQQGPNVHDACECRHVSVPRRRARRGRPRTRGGRGRVRW